MANKRRRKRAAEAPRPAERASSPAEATAGQTDWRSWAVPGVLLAILLYLLVFYGVLLPDSARFAVDGKPLPRRELLLMVLDPDVVPGMWFPENRADFAVFDRLPLLALAAAMLVVAGLAGWLVLVALGLSRRLDRLERGIFSLGLGLQAVSLYTLAVGLAGGLASRWPFVGAGAAVLAAAAYVWRREAVAGEVPADNAYGLPEAADERGAARWLGPGFLWLLVPYVFLMVWAAMMPPWDFDVREYHLQAPKEWYQAGRVTFLPHNVYGNMPLGAEMHAAAAMALAGDWWQGALVGKLIMGCFSPLAAFAVFAAGRRFFSVTAGVAGAAICISIPWLTKTAATGFNEGALAFYLLAAVYALMLAANDARPGWIVLAGLFIGAAISCKYTALVLVALPLFLWVWAGAWVVSRLPWRWLREEDAASETEEEQRGKKNRARPQTTPRLVLDWRAAGILIAASLVSGGPWLVKNAVLTGNPVYPLMAHVLGGKTRTPEKDAQWRAAHDAPGETAAEKFGAEAWAEGMAAPLVRAQWTSPILVPLAVVSLLVPRHRRRVVALWMLLVAFVLVWWLATHRIERFLVPALPIAALLAGVGVTWQRTPLWRHAMLGLLFWALVLDFALSSSPVIGIDFRFLESLASLRGSSFTLAADHEKLNELVPPGKRVLLVGDAEPFDLTVPALYSTCFDDCVFEQLVKDRTPAEQRAALAEAEIAYVYVDWPEIARYRSPGNYGFTDFVQPEVFERLVADGVLAGPDRPRLVDTETGQREQPQIYLVIGSTAD